MAPKETNTSLDPKEVEPTNIGDRRLFMERYFEALVVDNDRVKEARKKSEHLMSKHLAGKGLRDVNVKYFEYHVDVTVWKLILRDLNRLKAHPWPWTLPIDENDLTEGVSYTFRNWCSSNMPTEVSQVDASATSQSEDPAQLEALAESLAKVIAAEKEVDKKKEKLRKEKEEILNKIVSLGGRI
ncbi:hypothetical protein FBEOM_3285 [Fusarium beomiforme]|uniref:Uncharacterized protein n=1 Tax=Fusarium beomiforme TaxID=44412 RepID=A0A9P5E242_9HYPO|nr:hypothetical protein FBEOM_3285 [Fusarium beomiforme]